MSKAVPTRLDQRDVLSAREYIEQRVDRVQRVSGMTECWEWRGFRLHAGHGQAKWERYPVKAHRLSYAAFRQEPGEMGVLHDCDNPPCCNPDHLFLGTKGDNNRDAHAKGRYALRDWSKCVILRGAAHGSAKVTLDMYWEVHALRVSEGLTRAAIAKVVGVNSGIVGKILNMQSGHWSHAAFGPAALGGTR